MKNLLKSPLFRISLALSLLTVSMLLISDFLGLVPDTQSAELKYRKITAESLAIQLSSHLSSENVEILKETLSAVVDRNDQVVSAGIRQSNNELLLEFGDHNNNWLFKIEAKSTPTQVQVPLYNARGYWGKLELRFKEMETGNYLFSMRNSFLQLVLFVGVLGFISYLLFLKRALRELNPDEVIPERVRKALDTFAEGLLVMDKAGRIVFSNTAFLKRIDLDSSVLVGKNTRELGWKIESVYSGSEGLPWECVLNGGMSSSADKVQLTTALDEIITFNVNATPISTNSGNVQGVMITFDDVSEIEKKNEELNRTLIKLENSQQEISSQNQELQVLATRDPLTGVLNRRSFFQGFHSLFDEAVNDGEPLCCMMVDIDHFKSVNDSFGHAVGDKVIKWLADTLMENSRPNDLVGRYGGEEFCLVLPGVDILTAGKIAERIRRAVELGDGKDYPEELNITSSFGVATLQDGAASHSDLIEQADWALYSAKNSGRNRVIKWSKDLQDASNGQKKKTLSNVVVPINNIVLSNPGAEIRQADNDAGKDKLFDLYMNKGGKNKESAQSRQRLMAPLSSDHGNYLPDRVILFDRIDQAIKSAQRNKRNIAIMLINFETLQRVSDAMGLTVSEKLTSVSIKRLKNVLRETDTITLADQDELSFTVSRLNSNQIVVVLTDLANTEVVTGILKRIFTSYEKPVVAESNDYYLSANIGVSLYPFDGQDAEILLRNASSAMREVMESTEMNSFRFYADEINQRFVHKIQLESELHKALERDELELYFQPKVDLKTGEIVGMEALLRWQHTKYGFVSPADFIPLAEQTGLIEEIGLWVIRKACKQINYWKDSGLGLVTIAVNLSPVQFRKPRLAKQIIDIVRESGIPTSALEIEITEGVIMQDIEAAVTILQQLHSSGLSVSLDDFGTGYSSLSYLKRFPLSKIKIDRSFINDFVHDANEASIVSAIIAMGHSLGLHVVAEGVETLEQLHFLQDLQCDEMQGFLVSKPLPRDEAKELLTHPGKVRRLVIGNNRNRFANSKGQLGPTPGMIGLLNDCPTNSVKQSNG